MYTIGLVWWFAMTERQMLSGRVPKELKALVDADPRNNQEVLRAALWREFGGERMADIEREVREKRNRIKTLENQIEERKEEKSEERQKIEALERKLERDKAQENTLLEEARDKFSSVPDKEITPDNPGVQKWADKLDMEPKEFIESLEKDQ